MVISEIFKKKGEPFFRILEEKMSLLSLKKKNSVIALGGGAFLNNKIQKEILKNHISIWLKWDNKNLIDRIKNSQKRPIAIKLNNLDLNKLIDDRSKIYSKAKYQIKCDRLTKIELMERIIKLNDKS